MHGFRARSFEALELVEGVAWEKSNRLHVETIPPLLRSPVNLNKADFKTCGHSH